MTTERIKEIQLTTGYPDSVSVQQALLQVWNEVLQESNQVQAGVIRQLPKHWQIDLMVDGENILSIGDNHLSGLDDLTPYEDFISSASETLKNFTSRNTLGV